MEFTLFVATILAVAVICVVSFNSEEQTND